MAASKHNVKLLLAPVIEWIERGGDAWEMNLAYWDTRRELMDMGEMFDGPPAPLLSNIDTTMDSFSPDPGRGTHQIDEVQLRKELTAAIEGLRRLSFLTEE
jgi:hypothetical protein